METQTENKNAPKSVPKSRIGKKPIAVPASVKVHLSGNKVTVEGPKGRLERQLHTAVQLRLEGTQLFVETVKGAGREASAMHGMARTLVANMVKGVVEPFKKTLEITGVGYRAELKGDLLNLQLGFSHDVAHPIPKSVKVTIDKQVTVHLESVDKETLGQVAAAIRAYRPCEPYKGKGVKYSDERILRKEGKTGAS